MKWCFFKYQASASALWNTCVTSRKTILQGLQLEVMACLWTMYTVLPVTVLWFKYELFSLSLKTCTKAMVGTVWANEWTDRKMDRWTNNVNVQLAYASLWVAQKYLLKNCSYHVSCLRTSVNWCEARYEPRTQKYKATTTENVHCILLWQTVTIKLWQISECV